jgi:hypothetical protein
MPEIKAAPPTREGFASLSLYELAGRRVSVETDAEWVGRFARDFMKGFRLTPRAEAHAGGRVDLRLQVRAAAPPPLPPGLTEFKVQGGSCHADARSYHIDVGPSRVAVGPVEERSVTVWLGETDVRARRDGSLLTAMSYALLAALRRCRLYDFHAAGLVEPRSGRCFLFPGSSGSGKTSLALRLSASGWGYLSDDLLAVFDAEGAVEARGLRYPFQTDAETLAGVSLARLEEALGPAIPYDPTKRKLDPAIAFPGQLASTATPAVLCFPSVTGEEVSRVERVGQSDAMMRLLAMCPWASYDASAARDHLAMLGRLVRQCETYSLNAGRDIFDDPRGADRLLAPLS